MVSNHFASQSASAEHGSATNDLELLHAISVALISEQDSALLYGKIVDAAVAITGSQFGTMQILTPLDDPSGHGGELRLLASRGLSEEAIGVWQCVTLGAHSSCTQALKTKQRAIITDFETWEEIQGTPDLDAFRAEGIRSAQTTPLFSRAGVHLGMLSTHWVHPHEPSERDLRMLDILARQAADLLERTIAEEALREREAELERAVEMQKMLTAELSHRVKNMLATVQAIASQTLRHGDDPARFVPSFSGRIQSMARVHSQLSDNDWQGADLTDVIREQLKHGPVDERRVSASGPAVHLGANMVPNVAMMLHELGTNSIKYGALSKEGGHVNIKWAVTGDMLEFEWCESGGPVVDAPIRPGFGTRLIESTALGISGQARMSIEAEGIRWEIVLPLPRPDADGLKDKSSALPASAFAKPEFAGTATPISTEPLAGKRYLVIEDEPLVAMEIATILREAGADIIGPAGNIAAAFDLIDSASVDAVLLDANLGGRPVDDIAAALTAKHLPFAFVSGYGKQSLPQSFADTRLLSKPFDAPHLLEVALGLVELVQEKAG